MFTIRNQETFLGISKRKSGLMELLNRLEYGQITLEMPNGVKRQFVGNSAGPNARISINSNRFFPRILLHGEIGFAEDYFEGVWDTPDLQALLDLLVANSDQLRSGLRKTKIVGALESIRHRLRSNSKRQARKNISYHYDLGNDFYSLWLDETMTYSSGLFDPSGISLVDSQARKYDAVANSIGANGDSNLLEIGCGWGGFAEHVAKTRGSKVTGLTISQEQYDFAKKRIFKAGLSEKVDIVLRDYRDEQGQYDGVASIEMFEAVGEEHWQTYFDTVRNRLKPQAKATIQTITIADDRFEKYRNQVDFIQKYIFPGGMLPSPQVFTQQADLAGLSITENLAFGQDYSQTLRIWSDQFNAAWPSIQKFGFDDRFRRMWNYYLAACAASFRYENTNVIQFTLTKN